MGGLKYLHGTKPMSDRMKALYAAQGGLCCHCGKQMTVGEEIKKHYDIGWTREHVFPRHKYLGIINNILLAHLRCNGRRGPADPTPELLAYARSIYCILGLTPFQPHRTEAATLFGTDGLKEEQK